MKKNKRIVDFSRDFLFPAGFREAVCKALVSVCKDSLTFESLSLAGSLGISLDNGKMTYLHIVETIANNDHLSFDPLSNNVAGPIIKQEPGLQSYECCDDENSVYDESTDDMKGEKDVLGNNFCEGSDASNSCDGEMTENDSNANDFGEYVESKVEKHDDFFDNSIEEPQGNTKACLLLSIYLKELNCCHSSCLLKSPAPWLCLIVTVSVRTGQRLLDESGWDIWWRCHEEAGR